MGLSNGKIIVHIWGCHDLHTVDGEFLLKRTAVAYVVYWILTGHYIKLNHCCDVTLLLKVLILFKESTVIQLILKRIHTVDS